MLLLNAAAISENLPWPAANTAGQIKSIHHDYINILTAGRMVTLVRAGMDHIPFGIEVDPAGGWLNRELKQAQPVLFLNDALIIDETLAVQGVKHCPRFSCRSYYRPPVDNKSGQFSARLRRLQQIGSGANKEGGIMAFIGQYDAEVFWRQKQVPGLAAARIPRTIKTLINGILAEEECLIRAGICGLLGVGPGSTPSGDDFLLGFLSGIVHLQPQSCRWAASTMAQLLVQNAPVLTTHLSVEYIRYGVKGLYHQRFGELICSFGAGTEQDMIAKATKLTQLGHFSGADLLAGFVYGGFTALAAGQPSMREESANENS